MTQNRTFEDPWRAGLIVSAIIATAAVLLLLGLPGYVGYAEIERLRQEKSAYNGYDPTEHGVPLRGSAPSFPSAEHQEARVNHATCVNPYSREDADLCAQWAAVKAVRVGNDIGISSLRASLVGTLLGAIGILLTAVGIVVASLASRDAARAVRAFENVDRGFVSFKVARSNADRIELNVSNVGRTPIWIYAIREENLGIIQGIQSNGIQCIPPDSFLVVKVGLTQEDSAISLMLSIEVKDVFEHFRTVKAKFELRGKAWLLAEMHDQGRKQHRHFPSP